MMKRLIDPTFLLADRSRVGAEGTIEGLLSGGMDLVGLSIVDLIRGHEADADVVVVLIVPGEEVAAELPGVFDAAEALWEPGLILQGLEVAFRERIVVGGVGSAVRLGDAEIGEELGGGLGRHGAAAVGMQGELAGRHLVLNDGVVEQRLEQTGVFRIGDAPADDPTAEDVEDDVEVEVGPFTGPISLVMSQDQT
jgi:hypothetical protein